MRRGWVFLGVLWVSLAVALPLAASGPDDGRVVHIVFASPAELAELAARLDVWEVHRDAQTSGAGYVVAYVSAADAERLTAGGLELQVASGAPAQPETIPGFACYRTVEEIYAQLEQWVEVYPELTESFTIGQSYEGRPLQVLRLTNEATGAEQKPVFFLMANIHGRELITPETALVFIQRLLENYGVDPDVTWLLDAHLIYVLVSANPDGHVKNEAGQPWAYWRKNTRPYGSCSADTYGIDLNRNSSFHWGGPGASSYPCDDTYRGPSAASESETAQLEDFVATLFPDQRGSDVADAAPDDATGVFITLHSYSNLVLWPWGDVSTPAPNHLQLQMLGRRLAAFNGYEPDQAVGLYPTSGTTDDWAYGELGIAAYTFEIGNSGDGFYPACSRYDTLIQPNVEALLYAAKVARTPYLTPFGPHTRVVTVTPASLLIGQPLTVQAVLNDADSKSTGQTVVAAEVYLAAPPWMGGVPIALAAADGAFDAVEEIAQGLAPTTGLTPGRHLVYVRGQDAQGFWGPVSAAFVQLMEGSGLTGTVVVSGTTNPLPGVEIVAEAGAARYMTHTDAAGYYALSLEAGIYTVTASLWGYAPDTTRVSATAGQIMQQDFALARLPQGMLSLMVAELGTAQPLTAAIVLQGMGWTLTAAPTLTLELPVGMYTLTATAAAHQARSVSVSIDAGAWVTHTFRLPPTPALLVVDDDAGRPYETYLLPALDTLAIPYVTWTVATQGPVMSHTLAGYTGVLWFTGDDALDSLSPAEQTALAAYLADGGRLFLTGQNIGMDIKDDAGNFFREVLHAGFIQDNANVMETLGLSFYTGITATLAGGDGADNQSAPDVIAPYDAAATPVFTYTTGAAGLAVEEGAPRLIYLAFGLEGVSDIATRIAILRGGLAWLGLSRPPARLHLSLTPQPSHVYPDVPVTYTLTLLNDSLLPMTEGALTLTLPPSVTLLSHATGTGLLAPGMLLWDNLALDSEAARVFTWTVVVPGDAGLSSFTCHVAAFWSELMAPVELTLTARVASPYALHIAPPVSHRMGQPGMSVSHHLTISNTGVLSATVTLAASPSAWPVRIVPTQTLLLPGDRVPLTITTVIPVTGTLLLSSPQILTVTANLLETPDVRAQAVLMTSLETIVYLPLILRAP
ncbi:MAG TPA: M14 family zinc carboxypeptidase [Anaerolineae bacterium]|nr:M14 family zinc carboxypeptidase [Anaerolineae bacterium]